MRAAVSAEKFFCKGSIEGGRSIVGEINDFLAYGF